MMEATFKKRRTWIETHGPSVQKVTQKFPRLLNSPLFMESESRRETKCPSYLCAEWDVRSEKVFQLAKKGGSDEWNEDADVNGVQALMFLLLPKNTKDKFYHVFEHDTVWECHGAGKGNVLSTRRTRVCCCCGWSGISDSWWSFVDMKAIELYTWTVHCFNIRYPNYLGGLVSLFERLIGVTPTYRSVKLTQCFRKIVI